MTLPVQAEPVKRRLELRPTLTRRRPSQFHDLEEIERFVQDVAGLAGMEQVQAVTGSGHGHEQRADLKLALLGALGV